MSTKIHVTIPGMTFLNSLNGKQRTTWIVVETMSSGDAVSPRHDSALILETSYAKATSSSIPSSLHPIFSLTVRAFYHSAKPLLGCFGLFLVGLSRPHWAH